MNPRAPWYWCTTSRGVLVFEVDAQGRIVNGSAYSMACARRSGWATARDVALYVRPRYAYWLTPDGRAVPADAPV